MKHPRKSLALLLGLLMLTQAQAHQVWIEPVGKGYSLYFGEYEENLKETSPGLLDKMPVPQASASSSSKQQALDPLKQRDGFALGTVRADSLVAEVRNYPVFEKKTGEQTIRTKWIPAARHVTSLNAQAAKNLLDIVPTGKETRFAVLLRSKPLAKAKVTLVAPNGWQKQLQTDQNGELEVHTLWRGLYLLEVAHKENLAGEIDGEAYDIASFTSTLTFNVPKGPETPRPEAAKPNQGAY